MMSDKEFAELKLRATICPRQCSWPKSEYVHWQKLHQAIDEARARVSNAYMQMDEIDIRTDLSREDKRDERRRIAAQAIAEFEASRTLARAREAVRLFTDRDDVSPEIADAVLKAMKEAGAGWQRAIDKIAERPSLSKTPSSDNKSLH
jgi:uncharacterized protein (DUF4415 family)